jgi:hypothetical protein
VRVVELAHQLGTVAVDLPLMLSAPLFRRRHLRWGATAVEVAEAMAGDDLLPAAQFRATRAITIDVPPAAVWPWLVQVGRGRAGWYSNDLLDEGANEIQRWVIARQIFGREHTG